MADTVEMKRIEERSEGCKENEKSVDRMLGGVKINWGIFYYFQCAPCSTSKAHASSLTLNPTDFTQN